MKFIFAIFTLLLCLNSYAKEFQTSYMTVDLPRGVTCKRVKKLWICKDFKNPKAQFIIYMTSKLTSPGETFQQYEKHFSQPKTISNQDGTLLTSKVYHSKRVAINGHTWLESLHFNSELNNYFTYYLFTTKNGLSMATNITVHKDAIKKYNADIYKFKKSIRLKNIKIKIQRKGRMAQKQGANEANEANELTSKTSKIGKLIGDNKKALISLVLIVIAVALIAFSFKN